MPKKYIDDERYSMVVKIRAFEELILELFSQDRLSGTTHTYIGEEATAVALMQYVQSEDFVFSNHRCHGHYLAYGGPEELLLAEIMSKRSGLCQGRGGSQHIHYKNFFTNGIQGGIVPNAVGVGLANKLSGSDSNVIVFLGDGTLGQGVVYESLNIAAVYSIPILFVIEDNQYAMSTKREEAIAGVIKDRISGFGIHTMEIESTDIDALDPFFSDVFSYLDDKRQPVCAIVHNYRLGAHSKGDDTRDPGEIDRHRALDPARIIEKRIGKPAYEQEYGRFRSRFLGIAQRLEKEGVITITEASLPRDKMHMSCACVSPSRYVEKIREAFGTQLEGSPDTVFIGEDIRDPYGGAFKATRGLTERYGSQILNMPISEACMIGLAVGMSMNHKIPVVELMFGDFMALGFDQILNHAAKYAWVYGDGIRLPMVIRMPMGAKRGYGPTHSQSLEKFLIGIPLLRVLALSALHDPSKIYKMLFKTIDGPTIVIENKRLYSEKCMVIDSGQYRGFIVRETAHHGYPTFYLSMDPDETPDIYAITYGGMAGEVIRASETLMMQDEIQVDILVLSQLSPLPIDDIKEIVPPTASIVTIEEGTKTGGIGAEMIAACIEHRIGKKYHRIAACDLPIPNGIQLEGQMIPGEKMIIERLRGYCDGA